MYIYYISSRRARAKSYHEGAKRVKLFSTNKLPIMVISQKYTIEI